MKLSNRTLNWLIIGYFVAILFFSTAPFNTSVRLNKIKVVNIRFDYLLHVLLFIPWMILTRWRWAREKIDKSVFWLTFGAGFLLAGFSEGLQYFIPSRSVSYKDLLANLVGLASGALISLKWKMIRDKKTEGCMDGR